PGGALPGKGSGGAGGAATPMGGGAGGGPGAGPSGGAGGARPSSPVGVLLAPHRDSGAPLLGRGAKSRTTPAPGGPGAGGGFLPGARGAGPRPGAVGPSATVDRQPAKADADRNKPPRTEFVVLFFWKEATPSDDLMGFKAPEPDAGGAVGGGGMMGGA